MPSRNTIKIDVPDSYYHVYARGASKQPIFLDDSDYAYFIGLFERYLEPGLKLSPTKVAYPNFANAVQLLAFCLMGNHFHLLVHQSERGSMTGYMRCVMTSYSRYFNHKYKRTGSLFESRYKASRIDNDIYLQHISRYIHLNPRFWKRYQYSSYRSYIDPKLRATMPWLSPEKIIDLFDTPLAYADFVADYEDVKAMFEEVKYDLADQ